MSAFRMVFAGLRTVGEYAGIVAGTGVVLTLAGKAAKGSPLEPVLSGPVPERFMQVVDPLNLSGYRTKPGVGNTNIPTTLQGVIEAVAAERDAVTQRASELMNSGRNFLAQASERWYETATRAAQVANETNDPSLAAAAVELTRLAKDPPASAMTVLATEGTDEGRSLKTSLVDAVNREGPFDADALVQRMQNPGGFTNGTCDASSPHLAGPCCSACAYGAGSCASTQEVPEEFITGTVVDPDSDFFLGMNGTDARDSDDSPPFYDTMPISLDGLSGSDEESDGDFADIYMAGRPERTEP